MIYFSKYGDDKFDLLREHKFTILKEQVLDCISSPEKISKIKKGVYLASKKYSDHYRINAVYINEGSDSKVLTFFPSHNRQTK